MDLTHIRDGIGLARGDLVGGTGSATAARSAAATGGMP